MKVAVISVEPTLGKTVLCEVVGGVYSRGQGRVTAIFSTGDVTDYYELCDNDSKEEKLANPFVLKSIIDSSMEYDKELLDYGTQLGDERVYLFDILSGVMSEQDKIDFILNAIERIPADLSLVEICGDINSEINKAVLSRCDCCLILFDPSIKGIRKYKKFVAEFSNDKLKANRAPIISRFDGNANSEKRIAKMLGSEIYQIVKFPYNPTLKRLSLEGGLDKVIYNILTGDFNVVNLRMPIQEIMQFIYDTPVRKIIREIDKWYK